MRKKYIKPKACSIYIEEEELACGSSQLQVDFTSYRYDEQNNIFYIDNEAVSEDDPRIIAFKKSLGMSCKPNIWSDFEVEDW